jgi:hypothetical protein
MLLLAWSLFVFTTASVVSSVSLSPSPHDTYPQLTEILQKGVISKTYPGAVAIVGNPSGILYSTSVGYYSYDDIVTGLGFDMKVDVKKTRYDIASLTKVISTTSAIALLYQSGYLNLDDKIVQYLGKKFSSHQKDQIEIKHCLLHNAGFSPDPVPWYWDEEFACPNTDDLPSPQEDFSCLYPQIYSSLLNESLNSFPGETYVYSDLSFLTLQMVIGKIVLEKNLITRNDYRKECQQWIEDQHFPPHHSQSLEEAEDLLPVDIVCAYEAYVRKEVFQYKYLDLPPARFGSSTFSSSFTPPPPPSLSLSSSEALMAMESTGYLPPQSLWHLIAPTLNDTGFSLLLSILSSLTPAQAQTPTLTSVCKDRLRMVTAMQWVGSVATLESSPPRMTSLCSSTDTSGQPLPQRQQQDLSPPRLHFS